MDKMNSDILNELKDCNIEWYYVRTENAYYIKVPRKDWIISIMRLGRWINKWFEEEKKE